MIKNRIEFEIFNSKSAEYYGNIRKYCDIKGLSQGNFSRTLEKRFDTINNQLKDFDIQIKMIEIEKFDTKTIIADNIKPNMVLLFGKKKVVVSSIFSRNSVYISYVIEFEGKKHFQKTKRETILRIVI